MGKKKSSKAPKEPVEKEDKEFKTTVLPSERDSYVILDFKLLNWRYMNFRSKFRDTTHIFTIKKILRERHGRMDDLIICLNAYTEQNELKNEMMTLKDCGCMGKIPDVFVGPTGVPTVDESALPVVDVFYDFKPQDFSDPVMLSFK